MRLKGLGIAKTRCEEGEFMYNKRIKSSLSTLYQIVEFIEYMFNIVVRKRTSSASVLSMCLSKSTEFTMKRTQIYLVYSKEHWVTKYDGQKTIIVISFGDRERYEFFFQ